MTRKVNLLVGVGFLGIGFIGAFLPVLPSTCFFIAAAYFFGKSSTRLENGMLGHPKFGFTIRAWRETRSIPLSGKIAAVVSMLVSGIVLMIAPSPLWGKLIGLVALILSALYVLSRPTTGKSASLQKSSLS